MFISRVILFAFKNWKIASRYGFASGVRHISRWRRREIRQWKIAFRKPRFVDLQDQSIVFLLCNKPNLCSKSILGATCWNSGGIPLKIAHDLPIFASYYALLCICYCFSHLIGLLSVTRLSLLYKFTRFFIYFLFLSDERPTLETLHYTIRIGSTPTFLYFDHYYLSA